MSHSLIYITAGDRQAALDIARRLVESRLVACANVFDGATSIYWWQGSLQQESEAVLVAKTRDALVPRVIAAVKECHSYACPCVVALPIVDGNPAFLDWISAETAE
jgi:periplasmic divalent cation tolerance protein